jgi:hypothetical protein
MATTTPNYSFKKPTVSGDSGVWGGYLNDNWTSTDSLLGGGTAITGIDINSGTVDNATIGAATPNTGAFTTLSASSTFTLGATAITATGTEINVLDGIPATLTATELGYCDGVTSGIQVQLDAKFATAGLGTGVETFLGTPSSANLATAITDETGSGVLVFGTGPTLTGLTLAGAVTGADQIISAVDLKDYSETSNAIGSIGGGTQDIDLTAGNSVSGTVDTSTTTFTFSNPPATGRSGSFTLILTNGGSQTIIWPTSVDWAAATAPTLTAAGVDILTFITVDGGTIWYGFLAGAAMG